MDQKINASFKKQYQACIERAASHALTKSKLSGSALKVLLERCPQLESHLAEKIQTVLAIEMQRLTQVLAEISAPQTTFDKTVQAVSRVKKRVSRTLTELQRDVLNQIDVLEDEAYGLKILVS